jgi:hypothetical protein
LKIGIPRHGSLKPRHVEALTASWKAARLSNGTLKNRLSWVRFWASKVRKPNVIARSNSELGIEDKRAFNGNRAHVTTGTRLAALPARMQLALRLQMAFGLRLEESLKFRVAQADQGDSIALQSSWCKGGRARVVPLTHPRQRELLDELRNTCGDGSLIPDGQTFIEFRKSVEFTTWGAGIRNMHG